MRVCWRSTVLASAFLVSGPAPALPRSAADPVNDAAFFKCLSPRLLEGGIYAAGPFHRFPNPNIRFNCRKWISISKKEFKALATEWFRHDWSSDTPWWREQ